MVCGIPLAVKLTVREQMPAQLCTTMPTIEHGSDQAEQKALVCLSEPHVTLLIEISRNISSCFQSNQQYPGLLLFKLNKLPLAAMCFLGPGSTWCFYLSANILFQLFSIRRMHIWQHVTAERKRCTQHLFFQSAGHCKCFDLKISKLHKMALGFTTFSGNPSFTRRYPTRHLSPW